MKKPVATSIALTGMCLLERTVHCHSSLASLDFSDWATRTVRGTTNMFHGCGSLAEIEVDEKYAVGYCQFPSVTSCKAWWSVRDGQWYTKNQVVSTRSGIAGTTSMRNRSLVPSTRGCGPPLSELIDFRF